MTADELTRYLDAAKVAAQHAAVVLEKWRGKFKVTEKGRADLVTEADRESQQTIRYYLHQQFPHHAFLGEEDATHPRPGPDAPPTWIVDPIDGTTNYVHDCPLYCISIGLQIAGEMVVGVILDPTRPELFWASRGRGAWLNGRPIHVSGTARLGDALLATGFPPDLRGQEQSLEWWRYFSLHCRSLRRTGTTAINLAYVAAGRFDGFYAFDNHVWDVAAGVVLIHEAGGLLSNVDGSPYDPYTPDCVASGPALHPVLLDAMRQGPAV
jgi:myo-inositol-1(or 4)-monophosphatase